jgi:flagellar basal body-associated protein FliL
MNAKKWIFIGVGVTILVAGIVVTSKVVKKRKEDKESEKQVPRVNRNQLIKAI